MVQPPLDGPGLYGVSLDAALELLGCGVQDKMADSYPGRLQPGTDLLPVPLNEYGLRDHQRAAHIVQDARGGSHDGAPPRRPVLEVGYLLAGQDVAQHVADIFGVEEPRIGQQLCQLVGNGRLTSAKCTVNPDNHAAESMPTSYG
jgi:hypothetical protein